jgi:N utilization substance protein A
MARKVKHKIDKKTIIDAFEEMAKERNIDRYLLQGIVEETLTTIVKRKYGNRAEFEIIVNLEKGDIEIYLIKQIVEEVEDSETEISIEEANQYSEEKLEIGDDFIEEITLDNIADSFGRRLVSYASQAMNQRIRDLERDNLFNEYAPLIGELVSGEVYQIKRNLILVMHGKTELKLYKNEQIPYDHYMLRKNSQVKAVIQDVKRRQQGAIPEIILSRISDDFIIKLFEAEVPEITEGIVQIKGIAREAGERTKLAVKSVDNKVDPVGACIGMKGIRIHAITREVGKETIDLIPWVENVSEMIAKALAPAKVKEINVSEETKTATVLVSEEQVDVAVGRNGINVRLASNLTGYAIKLLKEGGEDIEIAEFEEELGTDLIEKLKNIEIYTARDFLDASPEELATIEGIDYETILENRRVMLLEFEEEESENYVEKLKKAMNIEENEEEIEIIDENKIEEIEEKVANNENEIIEIEEKKDND